MGRNYERLKIEEFGRHLITTHDLDPIYNALVSCHQGGPGWVPFHHGGNAYDTDQVYRWLIAYWCFYHAGVASFMSEHQGSEFWNWMMVAAENKKAPPCGIDRWPRGHERRHFRAKNAIDSISRLRNRYKKRPEEMVEILIQKTVDIRGGEPCVELTFEEVTRRAQAHNGFGPWIGFKIADMVDRVLGVRVEFDQAHVFMFKDPEKAAMMLWAETEGQKYPANAKFKREVILEGVTRYLTDEFKDLKAPPLDDRPINIQEVETVLCKWKSHMNGHYPLYNDIREINEGLKPWVDISSAAKIFHGQMPKEDT